MSHKRFSQMSHQDLLRRGTTEGCMEAYGAGVRCPTYLLCIKSFRVRRAKRTIYGGPIGPRRDCALAIQL